MYFYHVGGSEKEYDYEYNEGLQQSFANNMEEHTLANLIVYLSRMGWTASKKVALYKTSYTPL